MTKPINRRQFMVASGIATAAAGAYVSHRGLRFPALGLEPPAVKLDSQLGNFVVNGSHLIRTQRHKLNKIHFRAIAPEPSLLLKAKYAGEYTFEVSNISPDANFISNKKAIVEQSNRITRTIIVSLNEHEELSLRWELPQLASYTFASIGDTGGNLELEWCIDRAFRLGARFLLHLGDFNYAEGDYERSIKLFNTAPLPCYVAIGNHDFNDNGLNYQKFINEIGPLNNQFRIGQTRYANIDTAASFLPFNAGRRGELFAQMRNDPTQYKDTVAFTHKPLYDPATNTVIGNRFERNWLAEQLQQASVTTLLSGHIHIHNRQDVVGIDNIIVGQGLGHQDLMTQKDFSKMAIGNVSVDGKVDYTFEPLAMPMNQHCHPRNDIIKEALKSSKKHAELLQRIARACQKLS